MLPAPRSHPAAQQERSEFGGGVSTVKPGTRVRPQSSHKTPGTAGLRGSAQTALNSLQALLLRETQPTLAATLPASQGVWDAAHKTTRGAQSSPSQAAHTAKTFSTCPCPTSRCLRPPQEGTEVIWCARTFCRSELCSLLPLEMCVERETAEQPHMGKT